MLKDIDHIVITSEKNNKNNNIIEFQSKKNVRILIATIKSICQSINLGDDDGNSQRYVLVIPTFGTIESFQFIGRFFRRYTTKSKAIIKFIYIISNKVEQFDNEKLLTMEKLKEFHPTDPIQFSIILSNIIKSNYLERFIYTNYNFLPKNMILEFNDEPKFPIDEEKYNEYISIRDRELSLK